jgi:hypothetical protein
MIDINLFGHLTIDHIFEDHKNFSSLGAIANVWAAIMKINPSTNVEIVPMYIGEAIIYSDKETNRRYSKAVLNKKKIKYDLKSAKINHICYLNEIEDFSFLSSMQGFISADICTGKPVPIDILDKIDLLFISDEDSNELDKIVVKTKGVVLLHHPAGSTYYTNKSKFNYTIPKSKYLENINVLGAGDIFAGAVLIELLKNNFEITQSLIKRSHEETYKILREQNEKI